MEQYIEQTELTENRRNKVKSNFPLDDMLHSERIRIIVDEMLAGKSKHAIVLEYAEKWNTKPKTIKNMLNEAVVYLHQVHTGNSIEEMRSEQVAKLEELYSGATTSEKLKIIDLVSETLGLYDNKLTVKQEDEIKINLGV
jgi:hypothetical protein